VLLNEFAQQNERNSNSDEEREADNVITIDDQPLSSDSEPDENTAETNETAENETAENETVENDTVENEVNTSQVDPDHVVPETARTVESPLSSPKAAESDREDNVEVPVQRASRSIGLKEPPKKKKKR